MSRQVVILGGQGNGSVIAGAIGHANRIGFSDLTCAGYLNDREEIGRNIDGLPVLGRVSEIRKFIDEGYFFINTILRIDGQKERINLFCNLGVPDDRLAIFVHPTAYVAPSVHISPGTVIMPNVAISSGTGLGRCCLVMVGATIGHDDQIGDYCHIAAQACVGAFLKIGKGVHIGLNSTIRENLTIGDHSTIGMGAVLTKSVGESEIWVGNPAKFLRKAI